MSKAAGLMLVLAGIGSATYLGFDIESETPASDRLASLAQMAAEGRRSMSVTSNGRSDRNLATETASTREIAGFRSPVAAPDQATWLEPRPSVQVAQAAGSTNDAASAQARGVPAATAEPQPKRFVTSKPRDEQGRSELTRSIQTELKRVGCHEGPVTGNWDQSTRQAMRTFTAQVNATLPVEEPDYILLTLLQGHASRACNKVACPQSPSVGRDGACIPQGAVA